jgi:hypothetical protein
VRRLLLSIPFALTVQAVAAQDCASLGLSEPYLTTHFCSRLQAIAEESNSTGSTRSFEISDPELRRLIDENEIVGEAYRADPKKTLALIRRIQDAGGLTSR